MIHKNYSTPYNLYVVNTLIVLLFPSNSVRYIVGVQKQSKYHILYILHRKQEQFEDTKRVIRRVNERWRDNTIATSKRTNNYLQNAT